VNLIGSDSGLTKQGQTSSMINMSRCFQNQLMFVVNLIGSVITKHIQWLNSCWRIINQMF